MSDADEPGPVPNAHSWSPGVLWPGVRIAGGLGAVAAGLLAGDPLALLLTGLLALLIIPSGVLQLLRRPLLEVVDGDLALRRISAVEFIPRSAVAEVRALGFPRWGLRHHQMRLEYVDDRGREQLEVFTRMDMGADPRDVVATLERLGFPGHEPEAAPGSGAQS